MFSNKTPGCQVRKLHKENSRTSYNQPKRLRRCKRQKNILEPLFHLRVTKPDFFKALFCPWLKLFFSAMFVSSWTSAKSIKLSATNTKIESVPWTRYKGTAPCDWCWWSFITKVTLVPLELYEWVRSVSLHWNWQGNILCSMQYNKHCCLPKRKSTRSSSAENLKSNI